MFVRKKKNKSGSFSVQIIQKQHGKYKVVRTMGSSSDPIEIDRLYHEGLKIIPHLFNQRTIYAPPINLPEITELGNDDIRVVGPELIFGKIFDSIGFNQIPNSLFRDLVISRITHPGSKLKLSDYLRQNNKQDISADNIYYFLDKLNRKYKDEVERISYQHTKKLLNNQVGVVFYDMTTIYFESSKPDELRQTGFSKEGKHQHPQIYLGLLVGRNGYPIGYDIFEGGIYEGHTLIPFLERFEDKFSLSKPIVVADAGLLSSDNISALQLQGYGFILGARIRNEAKNIKESILQSNYKDGQVAKFEKSDQTILYVSYSEKRALKDKSNRERGLRRLEKSLKSGKLTKSNINKRGYNKYLKLEGNIEIKIDYQKFNADDKWDGLKGYITNTNLSGNDVIDKYNNLWKIERAFRISKTDLQIRPIYHRLRHRIEAHICISFASYVLYKDLERILFDHSEISMNKAVEVINKMYEISVDLPAGNKYSIKLKNNSTQQKIIDLVNQYL
jgi:transposase